MKNFESYKLNLKKSLKEKLFFLDKIDLTEYDLIVDFGCGTGDVLIELANSARLNINCKLVGYDTNPEMIKYAKSNLVNSVEEIKYIQDYLSLKEQIKHAKKGLIIFSSVLHEVEKQEQINIINNIMLNFHTVVIRDMIAPTNNPRVPRKVRKNVYKQSPKWQIKAFEDKWGKIKHRKELYRFLLMNEFVDNFETEVQEDYFSVLWDEINKVLVDYGYTRNLTDYTLSYRRAQVLKRFNFFMHDYTHRNAVYSLPTVVSCLDEDGIECNIEFPDCEED
jgi:ubiquinone/menaquinone biosynthesis C-methylase UbiE